MNDLSTIREQFQAIAEKANHGIPAYATEETQAGSYLASYLNDIHDMALTALAILKDMEGREWPLTLGERYLNPAGASVILRNPPAHPSPSPAPVELSDADVDRIAMDATALPTPDGDVTWNPEEVERCKDAIRHITKHYTLTPKHP